MKYRVKENKRKVVLFEKEKRRDLKKEDKLLLRKEF